jgi:chromosomal replication initiation ATPase DnaA
LEFWNKCSEKLENKLSQEDFNTWIRPLKGNLNKNILEIVAPNDFILNYVESNLAKNIKEIISTQSKKDISLVFKTHTKELLSINIKIMPNLKILNWCRLMFLIILLRANQIMLLLRHQNKWPQTLKGTTTLFLFMEGLDWAKHT